mgnify:CR=1 FL=1
MSLRKKFWFGFVPVAALALALVAAGFVFVVGGGARNGFCCDGEGTILHFDGNDWEIVMEYGQFR